MQSPKNLNSVHSKAMIILVLTQLCSSDSSFDWKGLTPYVFNKGSSPVA